MVVKTQCHGRVFTGVEIGAVDAMRYFTRDAAIIELQLDHLQIQCGLGPEFWLGCSEICDPRLGLWLESKNFNSSPGSDPLPLALIPSGKNCFRLQPIPAKGRKPNRPTLDPINAA